MNIKYCHIALLELMLVHHGPLQNRKDCDPCPRSSLSSSTKARTIKTFGSGNTRNSAAFCSSAHIWPTKLTQFVEKLPPAHSHENSISRAFPSNTCPFLLYGVTLTKLPRIPETPVTPAPSNASPKVVLSSSMYVHGKRTTSKRLYWRLNLARV